MVTTARCSLHIYVRLTQGELPLLEATAASLSLPQRAIRDAKGLLMAAHWRGGLDHRGALLSSRTRELARGTTLRVRRRRPGR